MGRSASKIAQKRFMKQDVGVFEFTMSICIKLQGCQVEHLGLKAHVEHAVRLIENHEGGSPQSAAFHLDEIDQPAGRTYHRLQAKKNPKLNLLRFSNLSALQQTTSLYCMYGICSIFGVPLLWHAVRPGGGLVKPYSNFIGAVGLHLRQPSGP